MQRHKPPCMSNQQLGQNSAPGRILSSDELIHSTDEVFVLAGQQLQPQQPDLATPPPAGADSPQHNPGAACQGVSWTMWVNSQHPNPPAVKKRTAAPTRQRKLSDAQTTTTCQIHNFLSELLPGTKATFCRALAAPCSASNLRPLIFLVQMVLLHKY